MPAKNSFDYAVVRLVPYVERQEFINVGIILFCRTQRFLAARIHLDRARLTTLAPQLDLATVESHLALIPRICAGDDSPIGQMSLDERFHWLVHPRSTVIQMSPVHTGLCLEPEAALEHLMKAMVCIEP